MLETGNRNRTQHPTDANATSSRSHAVFQVKMSDLTVHSSEQLYLNVHVHNLNSNPYKVKVGSSRCGGGLEYQFGS